MELSNRLKAVANMVSAGSIVCDAGCDHGYVSIYLVQEKLCPRVIAMDINEGPLAQAKEHIRAFGLGEYIETRQSDGVEALSAGEADCLILAGMGGRLVIKILTEGKEKIAAMKELILQPQSEIGAVRAYLLQSGYMICQEDMVFEDGKYYPMMKAVKGSEKKERAAESSGAAFLRARAYEQYGKCLLKERHPVLEQFLLWEQKKDEGVLTALRQGRPKDALRSMQRENELEEAARVRKYALSFFEKGDDKDAL